MSIIGWTKAYRFSPKRFPADVSALGSCSTPAFTLGKARLYISESCAEAGQIGFLRQVLDGSARLCEAFSGIGLYQPGGDALQGGLAGTVATNQADPIAGCNGESRAGKRRRCTKLRLIS